MSEDIRDENKVKRLQGRSSNGSLAKLVINNAVKHCDYHNKAIEEQKMWRRRREQLQKSGRDRRHRTTDDKHSSSRDSRRHRRDERAHRKHLSDKVSSRDRRESRTVESSDAKTKNSSRTSVESLNAELEREYYNELRRRKRASVLADATASADNLPIMPRSGLKDNLWRNV